MARSSTSTPSAGRGAASTKRVAGDRPVTSTHRAAFTAPGLTGEDGAHVADVLQNRLGAVLDLAMTLKHIHWNVVGPAFIGVHTMLDPQYAGVALMTDALAERIATLGGVPNGLPGALVATRDWDDYELGRADTQAHLGAFDLVYHGVIAAHRVAIDEVDDIDPVSRRPAHRPDRRARGVPLVRPQPPRGLRGRAEHRRREHRAVGGHGRAAQVAQTPVPDLPRRICPRRRRPAGEGESRSAAQAPRGVGRTCHIGGPWPVEMAWTRPSHPNPRPRRPPPTSSSSAPDSRVWPRRRWPDGAGRASSCSTGRFVAAVAAPTWWTGSASTAVRTPCTSAATPYACSTSSASDPRAARRRTTRSAAVTTSSVASPRTRATLLSTPLLGWRGRVAVGRLLRHVARWAPGDLGHLTVGEWIDGFGMPDDAADLMHALVRVASYGHAPDRMSADLAATQIQLALGAGVRYLDGGWQTMVEALADGLDIRRTSVVTVQRDGSDVIVATADGATMAASSVVVAAGTPAAAAAVLGRPRFECGPPVEASCLDLGTSRPAPHPFLLGIDRPLYLSTHHPPAELAPEGHQVVQLLRYLAPAERPAADVLRTELVDHARRAGIIADDIVASRSLHRMVVCGALTTVEHGGMAGRVRVTDSGVEGVYLAGDWVGDEGHLLDAGLASARARRRPGRRPAPRRGMSRRARRVVRRGSHPAVLRRCVPGPRMARS